MTYVGEMQLRVNHQQFTMAPSFWLSGSAGVVNAN
jgi:hypothetical protein